MVETLNFSSQDGNFILIALNLSLEILIAVGLVLLQDEFSLPLFNLVQLSPNHGVRTV